MRRQIDKRTITFNKLGGLIRFAKADLDDLIESGVIPRDHEPQPVGRPEQITRRSNVA